MNTKIFKSIIPKTQVNLENIQNFQEQLSSRSGGSTPK